MYNGRLYDRGWALVAVVHAGFGAVQPLCSVYAWQGWIRMNNGSACMSTIIPINIDHWTYQYLGGRKDGNVVQLP